MFTGEQSFFWSSAHGLQLHLGVQQAARHTDGELISCRSIRLNRRKIPCASLEVLWILGQSHLDDVQGVVVVFLRGEQQGQQVEGVDVVSLELQRLSDIT